MKEARVANLRQYPGISLKRLRESNKNNRHVGCAASGIFWTYRKSSMWKYRREVWIQRHYYTLCRCLQLISVRTVRIVDFLYNGTFVAVQSNSYILSASFEFHTNKAETVQFNQFMGPVSHVSHHGNNDNLNKTEHKLTNKQGWLRSGCWKPHLYPHTLRLVHPSINRQVTS